MINIDKKFNQAINKHSNIIDTAKQLMQKIKNDPVHDIRHVEDVLYFVKKILSVSNFDCDINVLAVAVFWHDVGRIYISEGHEKKSAEMLSMYFLNNEVDKDFAKKCIAAVSEHNYKNIPSTIEGKVLRDADTLALLGINRWTACLKENISLDQCIELLPNLESVYLELNESKQLCCEAFADIIKILYQKLQN